LFKEVGTFTGDIQLKVLPAIEVAGEVYWRVESLPDAFFGDEVKSLDKSDKPREKSWWMNLLGGKILYLKDTDHWVRTEMPEAWANQILKKEEELDAAIDLKLPDTRPKNPLPHAESVKSIGEYLKKLDEYSQKALEHLERTMRWFKRFPDPAKGAANQREWTELLDSSKFPLTWKMNKQIFKIFTDYRITLFHKIIEAMAAKIDYEFPASINSGDCFRKYMEIPHKKELVGLVKPYIEKYVVRFFGRSQKGLDIKSAKTAFLANLKGLNIDQKIGVTMPEEAMNDIAKQYAQDSEKLIQSHTDSALGDICIGDDRHPDNLCK